MDPGKFRGGGGKYFFFKGKKNSFGSPIVYEV